MHVSIIFTMLSEASVPFIIGLICKSKWYNNSNFANLHICIFAHLPINPFFAP